MPAHIINYYMGSFRDGSDYNHSGKCWRPLWPGRKYGQKIENAILSGMNREEYIRRLKQLIKKYHPDLCQDEYAENEYTEITIKLNNKLNQLKNGGSNQHHALQNRGKPVLSDAKSLVNINNQSYVYYKLGVKYYKNIHPNQFYTRNTDKTYVPKTYTEQLKILNTIYDSFNSAEYYFKKVVTEYPKSEWAHDARDKIELLKKLYKSYENTDVEKYNQIIDSTGFIHEIGLKMMK